MAEVALDEDFSCSTNNLCHTTAMNTVLFNRSGRLFASPSFVEGIGRTFDLLGNQDIYNEDLTSEEADTKALFSDWASVGDHLILATEKFSTDARK